MTGRTMNQDKHPIILSAFSKLDRLLEQYVSHRPSESDITGHQAFLWNGRNRGLAPINRPVRIDPSALLGIDEHKDRVHCRGESEQCAPLGRARNR
jgi:predicted AAA+ superfamily ATPase